MSVIKPQIRPLQQFFRSGPMPCPYIDGQVERKLFTRLSGPWAADINSTLSRAGFRRSHDIVYRPVCPNCQACVPVRIVVRDMEPSRSQRRVFRLNADLSFREVPAQANSEQYRLFARYQSGRHGDSDMARMSMGDFANMIDEGRANTCLFEARNHDGRLIGCMLVDRLGDGFSAVYSFFDPDQEHRSLGTALVLRLIEHAHAEGLPYVYLGYWIASSRKMSYKLRFRPLEALTGEGWELIATGDNS